jgi:hypothetical protein
MITAIAFARRQNHDSSIDSICKTCYQTIASADTIGQLEATEENHVCDPNGEYSLRHIDSQRGTF